MYVLQFINVLEYFTIILGPPGFPELPPLALPPPPPPLPVAPGTFITYAKKKIKHDNIRPFTPASTVNTKTTAAYCFKIRYNH